LIDAKFRGSAALRSKPMNKLLVAAALSLSAACFPLTPAMAALGGNADSVSADNNALRGQLHSTPLVDYTVQQISTGSLVVHEYVTRAGQVFAVTWQGPTPPDLRQLLGNYFASFHSAAVASHTANPGIHRHLNVAQSDLIVQAGGRLRDFHGLAYIPSLVPAGVSVSKLQ